MSTIKQKVLMALEVNGATESKNKLEGVSEGALVAGASVVAVTASVVLFTKALIDNTIASANNGAMIYDGASASNVSIEAYQSLNYVLRQTTGQINGASASLRSITTFLNSASTGGVRQTQALADLGLSYDAIFNMKPEERYLAITDAIGGLTDETEQNTISATIFGARYSTQVVGALDQAGGSLRGMMDTFQDSNKIIDTDSVNSLKEYDSAIADFELTMDMLKAGIAVDVIPVLERLLGAFDNTVTFVKDNGAWLEPTVTALTAFTTAIVIHNVATVHFTGLKALATIAQVKFAVASKLATSALSGKAGVAGALVFTSIQVYKLIGAMNDAEDAVRAMDEAEVRLSQSSTQAGLILSDVMTATADGTRINQEQLEHYMRQVEATGASEEDMANIRRVLITRTEDYREPLVNITDATSLLTIKTEDLSKAMLIEAITALEAENATKRLNAELANGPTMIAQELSVVIAEQERLEALLARVSDGSSRYGNRSSTSTPTASPTAEDGKIGMESTFKVNLKEELRLQLEANAVNYQDRLSRQQALAIENKQLAFDELQYIEDMEMQSLERRREAIASFASDSIDIVTDNWREGFDNIGKNFGKLIKQMLQDLIKSKIIDMFATIFSGGATKGAGLFGKILGKVGGGK